MTKKATISSTPHLSMKKSRKRDSISSTTDDFIKKSTKKPTISSTPDDSMKKPMEKAPIRSPPATKKKEPFYYKSIVFTPRPFRPGIGDVGVRSCRYCKRTFYSADLLRHQQCCYAATLDKQELESADADPDAHIKVLWLTGGEAEATATDLARRGLAHLNTIHKGIKKYKIVLPGPYFSSMIGYGPLYHFNFKAKANGTNITETFFCQLRMPNHSDASVNVFDVFVNLGPSDQLPWDKANLQDCKYCSCFVHHPPELTDQACNHLIRGLDDDDVEWLYGKKAWRPIDNRAILLQAKANGASKGLPSAS